MPPHRDRAPGTRRVFFQEGITTFLFALAFIAAAIGIADTAGKPDHGIITDLYFDSGNPPFTCTYAGRLMNCHANPEAYDLPDVDNFDNDNDNDFNIDLDAHGCHRVEYRSPYHWATGYDCVSEHEWQQLNLGDYYSTK